MVNNWTIAIRVLTTSNFGLISANVGRQAAAMESKVAGSTTRINRSLAAMEARAKLVNSAFIGLGVAAAAFAFEGIKGAAELDRTLTSLSITTGTFGPKFAGVRAQMRAMVLDVSSMTAQSTQTIGQEMLVASQGLNDPKKLMAAFPQIAKAADLLWINKGADPVEAVRSLTSLAHLWGAYSGKPLHDMIDYAYKTAMVQPEDLQKLVTQSTYAVPLAKQLGISPQQAFEYYGLMGQTGLLRGKGGTGLQNTLFNAIQAAAVSAHLSKAQALARSELRLNPNQFEFFDKNHNFRFQAMMDHLVKMREVLEKRTGNPAEFTKDLKNLFTTQGSRFLMTATSPTGQAQIRNIHQTMKRLPGVDESWEIVRHHFFYQLNALKTNFTNLMASIFTPAMQKLTPAIEGLADALGSLTKWFEAHPRAGLDVAIASFALMAIGASAAARRVLFLDAAIQGLAGVGPAAAEGGAAAAATRVGWLTAGLGSLNLAILGVLAAFVVYEGELAAIKALIKRDQYKPQPWQGQKNRVDPSNGDPTSFLPPELIPQSVPRTTFGGKGFKILPSPKRPATVQLPGRMPSSTALPELWGRRYFDSGTPHTSAPGPRIYSTPPQRERTIVIAPVVHLHEGEFADPAGRKKLIEQIAAVVYAAGAKAGRFTNANSGHDPTPLGATPLEYGAFATT